MLPTISLTPEQEAQLRALKFPGDLAYQAGDIALQILEAEVGDVGAVLGLDRDIVAKALIGQNVVGISEDKHQKFLKLAFQRQQYKRAIIKRIIATQNDFGLSEIEKTILFSFLDSAHLYDDLFYRWRALVVESELGRQAHADPSFMTKFRTEHRLSLSPYTFSVVARKDERYYEQSLPEAFPDVVTEIARSARALGASLRTLRADKTWLDYADTLAEFFENTDVTKYEALSKRLDICFLNITGRFIPLHAMEVYDDPGKYCVTPEMRLCIVDDRYQHVNDGIELTRANVMKRLSEAYKDIPALEASMPLMKRALAKAVTPLSEAGASMTLRPFGENIPNWDDLRAKEGVRIFIFMETAKTRWVGERTALVQVFGEATINALYQPYVDNEQLFDIAGIVAVGGHEVAHNAFITEGVSARITPPLYAKVEEHKANLAILSQIDTLYSAEEQTTIALYELGYSIMKMAQAGNATVEAYFNYAVFAINAFAEVGILGKQGKQFTLDFTPAKLQAWVNHAKRALDDLAPIYDHGTPKEAKAYMDKYFTRSGTTDELIKLLAS